MGNCLRKKNKILGEDVDEQESPRKLADQAVTLEQDTSTSTSISHSKLEDLKDAKKKNRVRFKLPEDLEEKRTIGGVRGLNDPHGDSKSGVVRIRLVVTQEEFKQILNYKKNKDSKFSSVEQLLNEIKLRGRSSVFEVENKSDHGSWSPALESIPEDQ
ncbi:hypothetical protein TorRG33x02_203920 [Trema orientale]|uniref:Uncharacterized protein n=1 Tax=Trema orientale TaxID=63057 RepID=A0A2P5EE85_TREOI|nr:hypothetical protein TorRG33x02_203920 [Trema orientale]